MGEPDAQEVELLSQFRERLEDLKLREEYSQDIFLIRWIRARDGNLNNAEQMLRTSLKWREENEIDDILDWKYPEIFDSLSYLEFLGYDNENSPTFWLPIGTWNLRKIASDGHSDSFVKYLDRLFIQVLSYMKDKVTSTGYPVTQFVFIADYDKFSFMTMASVAAIQMLLTAAKRFEANHPETMKKVYVLNAGKVFQAFFALIKPILSQRTMDKLAIYGTDERQWKPLLVNSIPQNVLPVQYGGCFESKCKINQKI